ncbi:Acg family FMN-binding oxidoreductase [Streptomyces sp. NBC_01013]|uniref:Acg family FMN-binding oxidoreductase n=1 Tax=Streptomyces sp. NBC_01013 TaxID=2903718 RepID=UPI0038637490|nr:nitroreductase [Streptomyces sp. NBC_01013]
MSTTEHDAAVAAALVEDAVTAPSMHNSQPWKFVFSTDTGVLALYGDPVRTMPVGDPDNRGLHLGCGAALFNLRVAAAHRGWTARADLLPRPLDSWHLADVVLQDTGSPEEGLSALHPAVRQRHTSRFPFSEEQIPTAILDGLAAAAQLEGCLLAVPGAWHTETVMELVHDSELFESASASMREEIAAWTRTGRAGDGLSTDGIPTDAFGPRQFGVSAPTRDFDTLHRERNRPEAVFEKRPQIALLGTVKDRPVDWLRAGQALQHVLLQATLDGLATSLMSQPLEWPELRLFARDPSSAIGFVHMLLRLGYGPPGAVTPRRPVDEVLTIR